MGLITYEDFLMNEYDIYKKTTDDPMEFDDFVVGSDYLPNLYKQITGEGQT